MSVESVEKNDLVKIDYVGMLEDGTVFDTTVEEEAKKADIYDKEAKYAPVLLLVGAGQTIPGLEEGILNMNENEEKEIFIPYEKGYGGRDASLFRIVPLSRFREEKIDPTPGMVVNIDGREGIIQSVSGGRVLVDFNHPLAGKNLRYKVKVVKILKETKEKVDSIFEDSELNGSFEITGEGLNVKVKADLSDEYLRRKIGFLNSIRLLVHEIKKIKFEEEYKIEEKEYKIEEKEEGKEIGEGKEEK